MAIFRFKPEVLNTIIAACGLVLCWGILEWAMGRGYDFTDDAYYLLWASAPQRYVWSTSEFGFLWHPIYQLVGGDIYSFRMAGAVILSSSAALFGWSIWKFIGRDLARPIAPGVIIAIATASFWNFFYWIPSPGYNELNLIGLLLYIAGLIFGTRSANTFQLVTFAGLAAIGLTATAFAKPTTALCGLAVGLLWLLLLRPVRPILFTVLACSFALVFFYVGILCIDGNIYSFFARKSGGFELLQTLSQTHGPQALYQNTIGPIVDLLKGGRHLSQALKIFALGLLWAALLQALDSRFAIVKVALTLITGVVLAYIIRDWRSSGTFSPEYDIASISPLLLMLAVGVSLLLRGLDRNNRPSFRATTALAILLLCAAFSFSAGTNNRTLYHEGLAGVFWIAGLIVLASAAAKNNRDVLVSGAVVLASLSTTGLIAGAMNNPYRLSAPMSQQTETVRIGALASPLLVDKITATYVLTLQDAARINGFTFGTPIIDLTGNSPGTVFALGGTAPGKGWLNGGYTGSKSAAEMGLSRASTSELQKAWVLTAAENSVDRISDSVLKTFGLNFRENYELVGEACKGTPCINNMLWKPTTRSPATTTHGVEAIK